MHMVASRTFPQDRDFFGSATMPRQGVVVIVSDEADMVETLSPVCDFLDLRTVIVAAGADLAPVLAEERPMALIAQLECAGQDGFHTMKQVARYNRDLPLLILTGGDEAMMGAADAIQEIWGLTSVTSTSGFPLAGQMVAFLFNAGRRAGCLRLVPV